MNNDNFLLGYGERLTQPMAPPPSKLDKHFPYTINEAVERLTPEFTATATELKELPQTANPDGMTVAALTLHPSFVAKSYYPEALLKELKLTQIGSKETRVKPEKWTRKEPPKEVRSTLIYVKGSMQAFDAIPDKLTDLSRVETPASRDIAKIEKISAVPAEDKIKDLADATGAIDLEVALHLGGINSQGVILQGFKQHLENIGVEADLDSRLELDGICFLPVKATKEKAKEVVQYSFLRYARKMPYIQPPIRNATGLSLNLELPETAPVDSGMRVAVFDGGIPEGTALEPWVRRFETDGVGTPDTELLWHGTAVTGTALFGVPQQGQTLPTPYCFIDHYRVLDGDGNDDELSVIKRIRKVIEANNYKYINISLGPPIPIDDDHINPWSAILDRLLYKKEILATIATGNDGDLDETTGNARIQPPSDAVNALGVGAADIAGEGDWQRAEYSSYGPGRAPGVIKPEIVAFGGSSQQPFHTLDVSGTSSVLTNGTSFASPLALRTALGVRAHFGEVLSPIALKALLVHSATKTKAHQVKHVGWGRVPTDFRTIVATDNSSVRVVYQGTLNPAEWMNVPIPLPSTSLEGMVTIRATLCYFTDTDPEDPVNYTKSGMEIRFRPNEEKRETGSMYPKSKSFFQKNQINDLVDDDLNYNAHFWETTLSAGKRMRATSLKEPVFNLHYNARSSGGKAESDTPSINYAMVITVEAPRNHNLYQETLQRYRTQLEALQPVVQVPVRT